LWPANEAVLHDERLRHALGADHTTISLTDTVNLCLRVAREASVMQGAEVLPAA
jgi:hypothetical protein